MLLRQDGRRHQINDLLAVLHCLKGCTDSDLRLAIADVPTDQAVHDLAAHHVLLDCRDRLQLSVSLLVRESFLKFLLPDGIRSIDIALILLAQGIKIHQFLGNHADCCTHTIFSVDPVLGSQCI